MIDECRLTIDDWKGFTAIAVVVLGLVIGLPLTPSAQKCR